MPHFYRRNRVFPKDTCRSDVRAQILKDLETFNWPDSATLMVFSIHMGYSTAYITGILKELIAEGLVERVEEGRVRSKSRYIWRLVSRPSTK